MAREPKSSAGGEVKGAELLPIRVVRRQLTRPDGTTVDVDVPVYPPFRLEDREKREARGPVKRSPGMRRTAKKQKAG